MSDLPPPFAIPAYSSPNEPTKLKLKVPAPAPASHQANAQTSHPSTSSAIPANNQPSGGKLLLHVPAPQQATKAQTPVKSPGPKSTTLPTNADVPATLSPAPIPTSSSFAPLPGSTPPIQAGSLQPATFTPSTGHTSNLSQQFSASPYQAQSTTSVTPSTTASSLPASAPAPVHVTRAARLEQASSASPSPSISQTGRQLKRVCLDIKPLGRRLELDYRDGVKTWAVQLSSKESVVQVMRMVFRGGGGEDEESTEEEDDADGSQNTSGQQLMEVEEEEEEEPEEPKIKRRGRGRPSKKDKEREARLAEAAELEKENAVMKAKGKARAREFTSSDVQVKLNGNSMNKAEGSEVWECQIPAGMSVLEVGEKGGQTWRVYLTRAVIW